MFAKLLTLLVELTPREDREREALIRRFREAPSNKFSLVYRALEKTAKEKGDSKFLNADEVVKNIILLKERTI